MAAPETTDEQQRLRRFVVMAAAMLAAVAGFVNSVFIALLGSPVSHVTGPLSEASLDVTGGDFSGLAHLATVLAAFFAGAIAAGAVLGTHPQATGRRYGTIVLAEAALLGVAPLVATERHNLIYAMIVAAVACGLQNGMFSNYRGMVLRTTHMTGTLTDLGVLLGRRDYRHGQAWKGVLLAGTVVTFVGGGVVGAYVASAAALYALWLPALCCALLGGSYVGYRHRQHRTHHATTTASAAPQRAQHHR